MSGKVTAVLVMEDGSHETYSIKRGSDWVDRRNRRYVKPDGAIKRVKVGVANTVSFVVYQHNVPQPCPLLHKAPPGLDGDDLENIFGPWIVALVRRAFAPKKLHETVKEIMSYVLHGITLILLAYLAWREWKSGNILDRLPVPAAPVNG